jgi:purine-nucleoside phosphorylase
LTHSIEDATGRARHDVAIVLGSGLNDLGRKLVGDNSVPYSHIEGMPPPRVTGHEGTLRSGQIGDKAVLAFAGRVHLYEGHPAATVTSQVRAAARSGCKVLVLTNAAGAINPALDVGMPHLISDQINLTGVNPLVGRDRGEGDFFHDLSDLYDSELRALARSIDPSLKEGVYAGVIGPSYETPAEIRMLTALGADLVGMSTVLEAIEARAQGMRVLGISVVTNLAAGLSTEPLFHADVAAAGRGAAERLESLLREVVLRL